MDASTSATIAALVVAILAMIVAMLQAAQQYIVTGQLIRLCDSVVFGKMPGQGRRVWQMHQFRFRIVYSIPQVSLRRDLWPETLPHIPSYAKGSRSLPDLGFLGLTQGFELEAANGGSQSVLVSAGEASWVSFCRAAQLSSGHSMVLDLVQGDADRCPPDLPNVPIQMSMRDIATLGLMTGMKCTQASFDGKSLSMQGAIGTITTSQHPSLGPLLHFSPRNMSIAEIRELTVGTGDISPFWMARMWDEVVVAGRRYTRKDRVQVEREEAFWADRPRERALVPATRNCSPPPDSLYGLRRRVSVRSSMTTNSVSNQPTDIKPSPTGLFGSQSLCREGRPLWTRSDGDWHLDNSPPGPRVVSLNQAPAGSEKQEMGTTSNMNMKIKWRLWNNRLRSFIRQDNSSVSDKHHDPFVAEIESGTSHDGEIGISQIAMSSSTARSDHIRVNKHMHPMDKGAELQPRWLIRDYINQKQKDLTVLHDDELTRDGPRLIEWYNEEELEIPELNGAQRKIANAVLDVWAGAAYDLGEHRPAFYARRWRFIVQQRQAERERRPISRSRTSSASRPKSVHSASRSRSRYRSVGSRGTSQGLDFQTTYPYELDGFSMRQEDRMISRSRSRNPNHSASSFIHGELEHSHSPYRPSSPSVNSSRRRQSRSRSHVRSRPPSRKDVEYGDTVVSPNSRINERIALHSESKSPVSPDSDHSHPQSRVGFDHAIQVFQTSSDEEEELEDESSHISPVGHGVRSEKWPAEESSFHANSIPPSKGIPKGILRPPRESFPEDPNPIREGVAPLKDAKLDGIPSGARWTRIDRKLVSPEVLEMGNERFEVTPSSVIVLRVLTKQEVQRYAALTHRMQVDVRPEDTSDILDIGEMNKPEEPRGRRLRREGSPPPPSTPRSHHILHHERTVDSEWSASIKLGAHDQPSDDIGPHHPDYNVSSRRSSASNNDRRRSNSRITVESPQRSFPHSRSRSRATSGHSRVYIHIDEDSSDASMSEPEIEEPGSISDPTSRFRGRYTNFNDEYSLAGTDDISLESISGYSPFAGRGVGGEMNWFWACQIDVMPGYLATPWTSRFSTQTCIGAITVILEAIGALTEFSQPTYLDLPCHPRGLDWMSSGLSTFPPYGISANHHHGTVISGAYSTTYFPGFQAPLFQIELLRHYGYQVNRNQHSDAANLRARLTELMALDSWLSYCGRQPEICGRGPGQEMIVPAAGAGDLLYTMPSLVERTMNSFTFEFANLERTSIDGGLQLVQQISNNLLDTLGWRVEGLTPTEKLFALVAMLRAAKMALCIAQGTDTSILRDILLNDVQVHLI